MNAVKQFLQDVTMAGGDVLRGLFEALGQQLG
jgi:hypothetical protein